MGDRIYQQPNGTYCAGFVDKFGKGRSKRSKKLQEVRQWLADASYIDQHSDMHQATDIYQTRIALYNMLELVKENDVIIVNPCKRSLKSDIGKPFVKKKALTIEQQKKFLVAVG